MHGATDDGPAGGAGAKKRKFDGPEPPAPAPAAPNKDGLEESNAGRKMLEKMVRPTFSLSYRSSSLESV